VNAFAAIYSTIHAQYAHLFMFQTLPNSHVIAKEIYFSFTDSTRVVFDHHSNRQFKQENNTGPVSTT
jgi:hypothetical protein